MSVLLHRPYSLTCAGWCVAVAQQQPSQILIVYSCLIALAIKRASLMLKLKHFLSSFEGSALVTLGGLRTGSSAIYSVQLNYQRNIVEIRSSEHIYTLKSHDQITG